jgi:hypothetical protein
MFRKLKIWLKMTVFWDVAPCSPVEIDLRFRGTYLKGWSIFSRLHGAPSQKTVIFILIVVRTWNLIMHESLYIRFTISFVYLRFYVTLTRYIDFTVASTPISYSLQVAYAYRPCRRDRPSHGVWDAGNAICVKRTRATIFEMWFFLFYCFISVFF